jgi:NAD(P)H dehydrogenase (quinone)
MPKVLVTGATGHLGRQTIEFLTRRIPNDQIVALARDQSALSDGSHPLRRGRRRR